MTQDSGAHGTGASSADGLPADEPSQAAPGYATPQQPGYATPQQPDYWAPQQPGFGTPQHPGYPSPPTSCPDGSYGRTTAGALPLNPAEERQYSLIAHLGGVLGGIGWVPSLIVYLLFKDRGAFVRDQAVTALNFQITAAIGFFVLLIAGNLLAAPIFLFNFALYVAVVAFSIIGGLAANRGQTYRYPASLSLVK